jgi:hypothetical protein
MQGYSSHADMTSSTVVDLEGAEAVNLQLGYSSSVSLVLFSSCRLQEGDEEGKSDQDTKN